MTSEASLPQPPFHFPIYSTHFAVQQLTSGQLLGTQLPRDLSQDGGCQLPAVLGQEVPQQGIHLACRDKGTVRRLNRATFREGTIGRNDSWASNFTPNPKAAQDMLLNPFTLNLLPSVSIHMAGRGKLRNSGLIYN